MRTLDADALVLAATRNEAARHAAALDAVGVPNHADDDGWFDAGGGPFFYHVAIVLRPFADAGRVTAAIASAGGGSSRSASVSDAWGILDLASSGFEPGEAEPWMVRPPRRSTPVTPAGFSVERAITPQDMRAFEATTMLGFGHAAPSPGTCYGPALLADARVSHWLGRYRGRPVTTVMSILAGGVLGIYDVATLPDSRGRGFASAAVAAALGDATDRPAVLCTAPEAAGIYRSLGFEDLARLPTWWRPARTARA